MVARELFDNDDTFVRLHDLEKHLGEHCMRLRLTVEARKILVDEGDDPALGASPLCHTTIADGDEVVLQAVGGKLEIATSQPHPR